MTELDTLSNKDEQKCKRVAFIHIFKHIMFQFSLMEIHLHALIIIHFGSKLAERCASELFNHQIKFTINTPLIAARIAGKLRKENVFDLIAFCLFSFFLSVFVTNSWVE